MDVLRVGSGSCPNTDATFSKTFGLSFVRECCRGIARLKPPGREQYALEAQEIKETGNEED